MADPVAEAMEGDAMTNKQKSKLARREFLRAFGAGATVAAAAAAAPLSGEALADTETNDEKRKARYQANSAHIQTYYRVNRYPQK
jgi:sugar (pentulose or hexulose) kinase